MHSFLFPRGKEEGEEGFLSNLRLVCLVYSVFIWEIDFFVYRWTEALHQPQSFIKKLNAGRHRWHVYPEMYEWLVIRPAWICFLPSLFAASSRSADLFEPPVGPGRHIWRWVGDPFHSGPADLHVGGLLQQTDAEGLRSRSARSNSRWQCESAASGHVAGCLDRGLCCQRLWDPEVHLGSSHKEFYAVAGLPNSFPARRPQRLRKDGHTVRRVKEEAAPRHGGEDVVVWFVLSRVLKILHGV